MSFAGVGGAFAIVGGLIMMEGEFGPFINLHAIICVFGGAIAATMIRFPMHAIMHGLPTGLGYFVKMRKVRPRELVDEISKLAEIIRKSGPIALESVSVADPFLAKGTRYIADGYEAEFIRDSLERERDLFLERLSEGEKIFRSVGDCAPAFGMVGTLLGMIGMFSHMTDPSKLGPSMAVALVATFYGAVMQNFIGIPIADKLKLKFAEEDLCLSLIIDGVIQLREAKSPAIVREILLAYLPEKHRAEFAEAA
jgi:chemotaxis protein MotA